MCFLFTGYPRWAMVNSHWLIRRIRNKGQICRSLFLRFSPMPIWLRLTCVVSWQPYMCCSVCMWEMCFVSKHHRSKEHVMSLSQQSDGWVSMADIMRKKNSERNQVLWLVVIVGQSTGCFGYHPIPSKGLAQTVSQHRRIKLELQPQEPRRRRNMFVAPRFPKVMSRNYIF